MKKTIAAVAFLLLLRLFFPAKALCCDADSFVYEEFGQRCLRVAEYIRQVQISFRLNLPDQEKHRRQLLNEWTSFFLDHGEEPPAGFVGISTDSWKLTMTEAGQQIGMLTYRREKPEKADWATIPFIMLAQPEKFNQCRQAIASWAQLIDSPATLSVEHEQVWIAENIKQLARLTSLATSSESSEQARIAELVKSINLDWSFVTSAKADALNTVFKFTSQEIRAKLKKEFTRWRKLFFM